jgi:hypothetical protein
MFPRASKFSIVSAHQRDAVEISRLAAMMKAVFNAPLLPFSTLIYYVINPATIGMTVHFPYLLDRH